MRKAKYTRQKNGYFQTIVWDGTYRGTKKHYITLRSSKSSKDLEDKVKEYTDRIRERRIIRNTDIYFSEYAKGWLATYKAGKSNATQSMYKNIIDKHLAALSGVKLSDVARVHYQTAINDAEGHPRIQQQIKLTVKQVMRSAVRDKLYPANLFEELEEAMEPIRYRPEEKRPLTDYERKALFAAELSTMDKCFVDILYGCGLRRGEALALTRFDVDLKNRTININKAVEFLGEKPSLKDPKSQNGFRSVPIPPSVFPAIENYVRSLKGTQLFTIRSGGMMTKSGYRRMWERIVKGMQAVSSEPIVGLTAHIFRHNYCSNLCYQIPRISIKKIAELLGDSEKMVMEVYNHIVLEKEDAAGAVADALRM